VVGDLRVQSIVNDFYVAVIDSGFLTTGARVS
jgi:hypothetical protein